MKVEYSARSHVGMVRENNEDNLYVDGIMLLPDSYERPFAIDGSTSSPVIFSICDGMGGEDNGEVASTLAVQTLLSFHKSIQSTAPEDLNEMVQKYVDRVNETIRSEAGKYGRRTGTTLALVVVAENEICCFNMGDSRIYNLQKALFRQITNDHTLAAEQIKSGFPTQNRAADENAGRKLTRCIGIGDVGTVENYPPIIGNCRLLLCSDGLTDMVSVAEIENILCVSERTADAANTLLNSALGNGGRDNVTIIVVDVKPPKASFFRRFAKKLKG